MEEIAQLRQELVQLKNMYSLNQDLSDVDTGSLNVGQKLQQQAGPSWNTNAIVRRSGNWPGKAGRQQSYFHVEAADHRSERSVQLAPPSWKVPEQFPQNVAGPGDLDPAQELMGPLDNPGTEQPKIGGYLDDQADAQRVAIPGQLDAVGYPGEEGIALHLDNNHGDYADDLKYQNGIEDAGVDAVNKIGEEPLAQVYPNDLDSERDEEDDDKEEEDGIRSI
ncbi:PREDICTED: uncharacterized protein LOC106819847 [Priapulus caudatus]|uniref:Uncharacterized protein LOC106819847 n=1 Tax=Priapulus caudatus TaxID=37621 RepID=A0ABM1F640_PRICU|nr:PREDICTED: uncharacterized protein LOC106819847 [Priapulus caudatus]